MRKKRICFFNSYRQWGGGEKWNVDMATRLADRGHDVVVVTNRNSELYDRLADSGVKRLQIGISNLSFLNPFKIFQLCFLFKREGIESIVVNLSTDVKVAGIAAKLAGVAKIYYARGIAKPVRNTSVNRFLFKKVLSGVLANSHATRKIILGEGENLISEEKVVVNYLGIDLDGHDKKSWQQLYRKEKDELVLGTAGRMVKQKNQRFLIDVAKKLKAHGTPFKLLIAGTGELEQSLKSYADASGLQKEVIFLGFVENIKSFMETIDIFLLSSAWEGFGYVLVEAMASCKPVISLDSSSEPEIVSDQHSGFIVTNNDINQFVRSILKLDTNRHLIADFGIRGRKIVEEKFTVMRSLLTLEALL